jgi:hypothetical protein
MEGSRTDGFFVVFQCWARAWLAHVAQLAERVLGKDEVTSSTLVMGSSPSQARRRPRECDFELNLNKQNKQN